MFDLVLCGEQIVDGHTIGPADADMTSGRNMAQLRPDEPAATREYQEVHDRFRLPEPVHTHPRGPRLWEENFGGETYATIISAVTTALVVPMDQGKAGCSRASTSTSSSSIRAVRSAVEPSNRYFCETGRSVA